MDKVPNQTLRVQDSRSDLFVYIFCFWRLGFKQILTILFESVSQGAAHVYITWRKLHDPPTPPQSLLRGALGWS